MEAIFDGYIGYQGDDENVPFRKSLTFMSFYSNVFTKMSLYQNGSFNVSLISLFDNLDSSFMICDSYIRDL